MRFRTVALALALACGFTASMEGRTPKVKSKTKRTYKVQKYKTPKYKASKTKAPKVKRHA